MGDDNFYPGERDDRDFTDEEREEYLNSLRHREGAPALFGSYTEYVLFLALIGSTLFTLSIAKVSRAFLFFKNTFKTLWNHAQRHFPIENAANAIYRKMVEKRAADMQKDFVGGVNGMLTLYGYLDVVRQKGFETLIDENTKVSVETGIRAAEKLHELEEGGDKDAKLAEAMVNMDKIIDAVRAVVPPEQWSLIVDHLESNGQGVIEAEVIDHEDDFDDSAEYDVNQVSDDPEAED